jgi:hypothetical protein
MQVTPNLSVQLDINISLDISLAKCQWVILGKGLRLLYMIQSKLCLKHVLDMYNGWVVWINLWGTLSIIALCKRLWFPSNDGHGRLLLKWNFGRLDILSRWREISSLALMTASPNTASAGHTTQDKEGQSAYG